MQKPHLVFLILLFFNLACQQTTSSDEDTSPTLEAEDTSSDTPLLEINLEHTQEEELLSSPVVIDVLFDPVFKRAKKYEAIPLKPLLEKAISNQQLDTATTELIFLCKDGYNPGMPLSKVVENEPYLAIRDLDAPAGKNWMDTLQGLWTPFYLVWTNHRMGAEGFAWPYGLKYLQFKASDEAYKAATPVDEHQLAGFKIYKEKCMKCHSMNQVGGVMGPEMNVPKNITEYWTKEDIFAFVKNPYSYRYNSKMPPVANIDDTELEQIYDYLIYMKGQKVIID